MTKRAWRRTTWGDLDAAGRHHEYQMLTIEATIAADEGLVAGRDVLTVGEMETLYT